MNDAFVAWNALLAVLYLALAAVAGARLRHRFFVLDRRAVPPPPRVRPTYYVFASLLAYGATRAVVLALIAGGQVPSDRSLAESMFDAVPAVFFSALQTALVAKWVGHVSELTALLHVAPLSLTSAITASAALLVCSCLVVIAAAIDVAADDAAITDGDWNLVLNFVTGAVFVFNGGAFLALGVLLRCKWQPATAADFAVCRRILAIAVVFGGMCVARGAILFLYTAQESSVHVRGALHTSWGAPTVITVEWTAIVLSLFVLGSSASSSSSSAAAATAAEADVVAAVNGAATSSSRELATGSPLSSNSVEEPMLRSSSNVGGDADGAAPPKSPMGHSYPLHMRRKQFVLSTRSVGSAATTTTTTPSSTQPFLPSQQLKGSSQQLPDC